MTSDIAHSLILQTFAAYSCDAYSQGAYGVCGASASNGGLLANTGFDVLIPLAFAGALIIAGGILLFKRWKRRRAQAAR